MHADNTSTNFEKLLLVAGFIKLALLIMFFASFSLIDVKPAYSAGDETCQGINLVEKLRQESPEAYEKILAEAKAQENAFSVLWKIEKEGVPTSWLFGTMHMADPEIAKLPKLARAAFDQSETVVVETLDGLDPEASAKAMASLAHLTILQEGTLRDRVADDLEDELEAEVTARGLSIQMADRLQPWLVATLISLPVCEVQRKQTGEKVLDAVLAEMAAVEGKELKGLETAAEQLTAMASIPESYHVSSLEETLAIGGNGTLNMIETMKALYLEQQIGLIFPVLKEVMPNSASGEGVVEFQEALIDKRNQLMVERAEALLSGGSVFMAVGALHLPGEKGIVSLLQQAGYTVKPVQ